MNIRQNDALREKLASEYVLGTLRGGARRRFESWLKDDAALRRSVAEWQDRLCPLAELSPAVQPAARVWQNIKSQLNLKDAGQHSGAKAGWFDSINFWRRLGVASTVMATVLIAVLVTRQPDLGVPASDYIALLNDEKSHTHMVVTGDAKRRQLTIKVVAPQNIGSDKSLELWALPKDGTVRSLGLVASNGTVILTLPENMPADAFPALAITLEPKGGSGNPIKATGPILFKGAWQRI